MLEKIIKEKSSAQIGFIIALLATLCYSLKPIIIKLIYQYEEVTSEDVLAWRVIISLPVYILVGAWVLRKKFGNTAPEAVKHEQQPARGWFWKSIILGAIGFYLAALLDLIGLHYISSQLARLILFTYPTLVAILGWIIFRQKISRTVAVALVLSYIGVGLIFAYDFQNLGEDVVFGSIMMFLSVLAFSLYVLLSKTVIDQVGGAAFTVVAMLSSGVCILIHFIISEQVFNWLSLDSMAFWLIVLMTVVTTVIPSFLIAEAISLVGPQKTSIAGTVGPAITSVFAVFLLDEAFGPSQLLGILLVVMAITYMQREPAKATSS
ncbi:MAG: DMT family transporter [Gammaproteobacteria bacterium]|nr:DMT family transporter [Gammaproteobacteria bacterium]